MRGKVHSGYYVAKRQRITPAYAGKSGNNLYRIVKSWDHPRLCGEKANKTIKTANAEGSPPPMRGKVLLWCEG